MNNKEKHTGVSFHKSTNKWTATISHNKKQYYLGEFKEKDEAIMIRQLAEQKIEDGIFLEWYNDYKMNKKTNMYQKGKGLSFYKIINKWTATISHNKKQYHLGYFSEKQDAIMIRQLAEQKIEDGSFIEWYNDYKSQKMSSKRPKGISFYKSINKWGVNISFNKKIVYLGSFKTMDEAIKTREIAEKKIKDGEFENWYNSLKEEKKFKNKSIYRNPANKNKWFSSIWYNNKQYYLGSFKTKTEAEKIYGLAVKNLGDGFLEWYENIHIEIVTKNKAGHKGVYYNHNYWRAEIGYQKKQHYLGTFKDKQDAIDIREIAEQKIEDGIFLEWYNDYKLHNNSSKSPKGICFVKNTDKWMAYIVYNKKQYTLGRFETMDEAIRMRQLADQKMNDGNFLEWFNALKEEKASNGIYYNPVQKNKWFSTIRFNKKQYHLGSFKTKDEAEKMYNKAVEMLGDGFLEWYENIHKELTKTKSQTGHKDVYKRQV